ncbi:hypothetical protein FRC07_008506 [Ceratobasidium sp. 392]|nr:hypothetical protein FRC07_008506 [Ceratobasidium sp. 392]
MIVASGDLGGKVDSMMGAFEKVTASAAAAEKAAEDSQNTLRSFVDAQGEKQQAGWTEVNAKNKQSHKGPALADQATAFASSKAQYDKPPKPSNPPCEPPRTSTNAEIPPETAQELRERAANILVEPNNRSMDTLNYGAIMQKADLAWDRASRKLKDDALFMESMGLKDLPRIKFREARRLPKGGIVYWLETRNQAAFLSLSKVSRELENGFGDVTCLGQGADILLETAPTSFKPELPEELRALERDNQLEHGDIRKCSWVKPPRRWYKGQECAILKVSLRSQNIADELIANGGNMAGREVAFRRIEEEPTQCLRCQRYGHRAFNCRAKRDACSQCGHNHRSDACPAPEKTFCVSCGTYDHASWDRQCPTFSAERIKLNVEHPENRRKFFDPNRKDVPLPNSLAPPPPATMADVMPPAQGPPTKITSYFQTRPRALSGPATTPIRSTPEGSVRWDCESTGDTPVTPTRKTPVSVELPPLPQPVFSWGSTPDTYATLPIHLAAICPPRRPPPRHLSVV